MATATRRRTGGDLAARLRAIGAPRPILSRDDVAALTDRQREVLDELGTLFHDGFAHLTMSTIAAEVGCSLRTLYELAPSRDELVLAVADVHLWRIGRGAMAAVDPDAAPLDAVRAYLGAATRVVAATTEAYARDLDAMPAGQRRNREHADYVVAVTRTLLDAAVERGDIAPVDTVAVAHTLANLAPLFIRPDVMAQLASSPKVAADEVVDLILAGLPRP